MKVFLTRTSGLLLAVLLTMYLVRAHKVHTLMHNWAQNLGLLVIVAALALVVFLVHSKVKHPLVGGALGAAIVIVVWQVGRNWLHMDSFLWIAGYLAAWALIMGDKIVPLFKRSTTHGSFLERVKNRTPKWLRGASAS